EITEVMVVTDTEVPVTPCGGCRQKLAEFCKPGVPITLANLEGPLKTMTLSELIPGVFDREQMGTG
ncbi:MAG: cytidine deaminase, partial [Pseudomonadota bacterium]